MVPQCLVPGPGMLKADEYCLLGCTVQIEEVWLWVISLHITGMGGPLLSLRTGMVNPGWSGSSQPENIFFYKMLKHHIIQKIKHINNKEQHQKIKTMLD